MNKFKTGLVALSVKAALFSMPLMAQDVSSEPTDEEQKGLETITVTAQKRTQSIQDVPSSISTLSGENFEVLFSGGDDILALATRVPGLYAETSNGRVAPRFYIRGLGNTDFDLAASQPVMIMMDQVVKENVILKSFPLFDIQQVEVLRGPQGTLFGRNTTAGIIKFDTVKPSATPEAYAEVGLGTLGTINFEGAVGGEITDNLSGRFSVLSQNRDDWIDNGYTGEQDAMGGFNERAWRGQLLWEPTATDMTALLAVYGRDLNGTSSIFRANALTSGSNELNGNYDRDVVYYDQGDNNPQAYENYGATLTIDYNMSNGMTLTSITDYTEAEGNSKGDIDGGVLLTTDDVSIVPAGVSYAAFMADFDGDGIAETPQLSFPGFIPFSAVTEDQLDNLHQFTQEFRLSGSDNNLNWQVGAFFFDSAFDVTSIDGFFGATTVSHENSSWNIFGQASYDLSDRLNLTAGLNYTDDEKTMTVGAQNVDGFALVIGAAAIQDYADVYVDDSQLSGELALNYELSQRSSVYGRIAHGFRAPTIQGRDVAFEGAPSVARAETVTSYEVGFKSDLLENTLRLNGALYYYTIDDMQFSAIGGGGNFNQLVNADKGVGQGFEVDATWLATDNLSFTFGYSLNDTEIQDANLRVVPCGSGQCTVIDPVDANGAAGVDGNPFPQAPKTTMNFSARYAMPVGSDGEVYVMTDYAYQGDTNIFLYDAVEFSTDGNFELGLQLGYQNFTYDYTIKLFGRNITDEENLRSAIDFNNLTAIDNSPRVWGIEFRKYFY